MDYQDLENRIEKLENKMFWKIGWLELIIFLGAFFSSEVGRILKIIWDIILGLFFYFWN